MHIHGCGKPKENSITASRRGCSIQRSWSHVHCLVVSHNFAHQSANSLPKQNQLHDFQFFSLFVSSGSPPRCKRLISSLSCSISSFKPCVSCNPDQDTEHATRHWLVRIHAPAKRFLFEKPSALNFSMRSRQFFSTPTATICFNRQLVKPCETTALTTSSSCA